MSTKALWTNLKMPHSGELGSQRAVSRKEKLRLLLLSAVSRNQAALAPASASDSDSDHWQNERQRFLVTGESDNNRRPSANRGVLRMEFLSNLRQSVYCYLAYLGN